MSFDDKEVIFVLGGPGSGKGTQCAKLVEKYGFAHLSAGDLLRAERDNASSDVGKLISEYIKEGKIVPMEITIGLLKTAMEKSDSKTFLIDGFPRAMDQCESFETTVKPAKFCIAFECPEEVLEARLLKRGETSGRSDDNIEAIKKRFHTHVTQCAPVIKFFQEDKRLREIDSSKTVDEVFAEVDKNFTK